MNHTTTGDTTTPHNPPWRYFTHIELVHQWYRANAPEHPDPDALKAFADDRRYARQLPGALDISEDIATELESHLNGRAEADLPWSIYYGEIMTGLVSRGGEHVLNHVVHTHQCVVTHLFCKSNEHKERLVKGCPWLAYHFLNGYYLVMRERGVKVFHIS